MQFINKFELRLFLISFFMKTKSLENASKLNILTDF